MNNKIKNGIRIFVVILLVLVSLILFFYNREKEDINNEKKENTKINESQEGKVMENQKIKLNINNYELTATLNANSSSQALIEKLKQGSIKINMSDYANMEKVGSLGMNLPQNDENITTEAGDLILYQGDKFVIYYDTNNWSLTKLGKIDNIDAIKLRSILGEEDVMVTLSLN